MLVQSMFFRALNRLKTGPFTCGFVKQKIKGKVLVKHQSFDKLVLFIAVEKVFYKISCLITVFRITECFSIFWIFVDHPSAPLKCPN